MTLTEIFSQEEFIIFENTDENDEASETLDETKKHPKHPSALDYDRYWEEWPLDEKHYSKKTGNRLYGRWVYRHREVAGAKYGDGKIIHHRNNDKHDNSKSNLQVTDRSGHCKIDPNSRTYFDCSVPGCKGKHFARHLCLRHYMQKFRKHKFGNYDKDKNYSKDER